MLLSAIVNPFSLQNSDADPNTAWKRCIDDTAFACPDPKTEEEYASSADEKSDGDDNETTWSASDPDSTDDVVSGATNLESAPLWLGTAYPHPSTMISSNRNPPSFFNSQMRTIISCKTAD